MSNEVSEKAVAVVEALNSKGFWIAVPKGQFIGEKDEVKHHADMVMEWFLKEGWPKDEIRVTVSAFTKRRNINSVEDLDRES